MRETRDSAVGCLNRTLYSFLVGLAGVAGFTAIPGRDLLADELRRPSPELERVYAGRPPRFQDLRGMQDHQRLLAELVAKCTVHLQLRDAHGSGTIVSADGNVLTAAHVVGLPGEVVIVHLQNGRGVMGRVLGVDLEHDLALVRLSERGPWPFLDLADDLPPTQGQWCAAAGHPGGMDTQRGVVFRVGRVLHSGELLKTDCELIGGDSGGPLVDMRGRVLGVHSRIGVSVLTNLHVPAATVRENWEGLVSGKVLKGRSHLGIRGDKEAGDCVVKSVTPDSPADLAGILPGDQITHFDGQRIRRFAELMALVQTREPGETIVLDLVRDEQTLQLEVTIGDRHGG